MSAREDWEATFIPGTNVLANELGITDADQLRDEEYTIVAARTQLIDDGSLPIPRTYDGAHLRAIHAGLFTGIYAWAGTIRTYSMVKGLHSFADPRDINKYLDAMRDRIAETNWHALDHDGFAVEAAAVYSYANHAHIHREGNGRTGKMFMRQLARDAGWDLDYSRVTKRQWDNASEFTAPDRGTFEPVPDTLIPVFAHIAQPLPPSEGDVRVNPQLAAQRSRAEAAAAGPFAAPDTPRSATPTRSPKARSSRPYRPEQQRGYRPPQR